VDEPAEPHATKRCRYCKADIHIRAEKCRHCGEWVDEDRRASRLAERDGGLSGTEVVLITLLFLLLPLVNVVVAHIMYHHWKATSLKKANQVNALSFGCFALQMLGLCVALAVLGAGVGLFR
jgi:hypothetical protein